MTSPHQLRWLSWHYVIYSFALVSIGVAAFGNTGWVIGLFVIWFWAIILGRGVFEWWIAFGLVLLLIALLLPAINQQRIRSRAAICRSRLHNLGLALHNYHALYGSFPPASVVDAEGRPMHSWRVLLLPFVDGLNLYEQYDFNEPWNGPHKRSLIDRMPATYACPHDSPTEYVQNGCTSYLAVVGDQTVWPPTRSRTLDDITDDTSRTVLLIEHNAEDIPWTEPRDLTEQELVQSITEPQLGVGHGSKYSSYYFDYVWAGVRGACLVDGSVRYLTPGTNGDRWLSLVRINDGGPDGALNQAPEKVFDRRIPRWGNWIALGSFVFLALLTLWWVWRKPEPA